MGARSLGAPTCAILSGNQFCCNLQFTRLKDTVPVSAMHSDDLSFHKCFSFLLQKFANTAFLSQKCGNACSTLALQDIFAVGKSCTTHKTLHCINIVGTYKVHNFTVGVYSTVIYASCLKRLWTFLLKIPPFNGSASPHSDYTGDLLISKTSG